MFRRNRRDVAAPDVIAPAAQVQSSRCVRGVDLHWLDGSPPAVARGRELGRAVAAGEDSEGYDLWLDRMRMEMTLRFQTWPLAYWPDGSMKWTAFAATAGPEAGDTFEAVAGWNVHRRHSRPIIVDQTDDAIEITNGQSTLAHRAKAAAIWLSPFRWGIRSSCAAGNWWGSLRIDPIGRRST